MTLIAPALQGFFTDRLIGQHNASPHTIAAYRDTLRLLLTFASQRTGKPVSQLRIDDLGPGVITGVPRPLGRPARQQRAARATPAWPRSTRCFAMRRCTIPNTPRRSSEYWPSRPNATSERS